MKASLLALALSFLASGAHAATFIEAKTDIEIPAKATSVTLMTGINPSSSCVLQIAPSYSPRKISTGSKFEVLSPIQFVTVAYTLPELVSAAEKLVGHQFGQSFSTFDDLQKFLQDSYGMRINDPNVGATTALFQIKSLASAVSYQVGCNFEFTSTMDEETLIDSLNKFGSLKPSETGL